MNPIADFLSEISDEFIEEAAELPRKKRHIFPILAAACVCLAVTASALWVHTEGNKNLECAPEATEARIPDGKPETVPEGLPVLEILEVTDTGFLAIDPESAERTAYDILWEDNSGLSVGDRVTVTGTLEDGQIIADTVTKEEQP